MVYHQLEQGDILSYIRVRLATIAYVDILLCSIWAMHKIRQTPITEFLPTRRLIDEFEEIVTIKLDDHWGIGGPLEPLGRRHAVGDQTELPRPLEDMGG